MSTSRPGSPSRHDGVTLTCPACQATFAPSGRKAYCGDACRAAACRRRRDAATAPVTVPPSRPRRPVTIYECGSCGHRALGEQRCDTCRTFMRRAGTGGCCPACDEPITIAELTGQEART